MNFNNNKMVNEMLSNFRSVDVFNDISKSKEIVKIRLVNEHVMECTIDEVCPHFFDEYGSIISGLAVLVTITEMGQYVLCASMIDEIIH